MKAAYGANYQRLVSLKNQYDPTNLTPVPAWKKRVWAERLLPVAGSSHDNSREVLER